MAWQHPEPPSSKTVCTPALLKKIREVLDAGGAGRKTECAAHRFINAPAAAENGVHLRAVTPTTWHACIVQNVF